MKTLVVAYLLQNLNHFFGETQSAEFAESVIPEAAIATILEFAAKKKGGSSTKEKECQKGYPCGKACIARSRNCRNPLVGQAKSYQDWVVKIAAQNATPKPNAPSVNQPKPPKKPTLPDGVEIDDVSGDDRDYWFEVDGVQVNFSVVDRDVSFMVGFGYDRTGALQGRAADKAALTIARIFKYDVSTRPDGFVYETSAWKDDGFGDRRAEAYERAGFSKPPQAGDKQYGVVQNGRLVPSDKRGNPV